jgi:hypothetical protein
MVSFQSGGIKDANMATLAALSTLGDAPSRPTKVFRVATWATSQVQPIALLLCGSQGLGCRRNEQSGRTDRNHVFVT